MLVNIVYQVFGPDSIDWNGVFGDSERCLFSMDLLHVHLEQVGDDFDESNKNVGPVTSSICLNVMRCIMTAVSNRFNTCRFCSRCKLVEPRYTRYVEL